MKVLEIDKKEEEVTVKVEKLNDLWSLYNIISKNDKVSALTQRRIVLKEGSKGERKTMRLKLEVKDVAFHEFSNRLRIKGTILEGPDDFVSFGSYHTFNVEINQKITIEKEKWLKSELKRLKESSRFDDAYLMLFVAIETGLSTIFTITNYSYNRIATIKKNIPGKRYEQSHRNKALDEFFVDVRKVVEENFRNNTNLIVVCGPGNTRDKFINYLKGKSNPSFLSKIKSIRASSGTESAIFETLKSKELAVIKKNFKVLEETKKIEQIFALLSTDADLIKFGIEETSEAAKKGAIKELFLADTLIRGISKDRKLEIEEILTNVENTGGVFNILNSQLPTGQRIVDLGSIVGILRYKI